jgi:hypothetical protein
LLSYLYRWIDDDEFELMTLHAMVNEPIEEEEAHNVSQRLNPRHLKANGSCRRGGAQGLRRVGAAPGSIRWSKRLNDTGAANTNVQVYWAALSSHMDRLVGVRLSHEDTKSMGLCSHLHHSEETEKALRLTARKAPGD